MLHIMFRGNRSSGSEEEYFEGIITYMGMVAILVTRPRSRVQTFIPTTHGVFTQNLALIGQQFHRRRFLKMFDGRRTTTMTDAGAFVYY